MGRGYVCWFVNIVITSCLIIVPECLCYYLSDAHQQVCPVLFCLICTVGFRPYCKPVTHSATHYTLSASMSLIAVLHFCSICLCTCPGSASRRSQCAAPHDCIRNGAEVLVLNLTLTYRILCSLAAKEASSFTLGLILLHVVPLSTLLIIQVLQMPKVGPVDTDWVHASLTLCFL